MIEGIRNIDSFCGALAVGNAGLLNDTADEKYSSRKSSKKIVYNLGDGYEAALDTFNDGGEAGHEFHIYKNGKEVGVFFDGEFRHKHGKPAMWPSGFSQKAFNRLKGLDIDMLRRQGRFPLKGSAEIKGNNNYGKLIRRAGHIGTAVLAIEFIADPSMQKFESIIQDVVGAESLGDGTLSYPEGFYIKDF